MDWIPKAAPVPHIEQAACCGGKEETGKGGRKTQRGIPTYGSEMILLIVALKTIKANQQV